LAIVCGAVVFTPVRGTFVWLFLGMGRSDLQLRIAVFRIAVAIPAYLLGARWGIEGIAVALVAEAVISAPVAGWAAGRVVDLPLRAMLANQGMPLLAVGLTAMVVFGVHWLCAPVPALLRIIACGVAGAVTHAGWLSVTRDPSWKWLVDLARGALRRRKKA
jgi:hypothetical protein